MSHPLHRHAVVIGGSIAGLATARVLSDHFDAVTVLERDELSDERVPRKHVPQGRHAHALLSGGSEALAEMFPGIMEEMAASGATLGDFNRGTWHQAGGYRAPSTNLPDAVLASRPLIEGVIRQRVAELPNVLVESGVAVENLVAEAGRVRGVRVFDGHMSREVAADLVVDCSGRASRAPLWLEELGYAAPEVVEVRCGMRYATVTFPRRADDLDTTFAVSIGSPPDGKRAGFLIPIEGERWVATIASGYGAPAPVDEEGFRATAATLPSPEMDAVLSKHRSLGPVALHHFVSTKRRRYERLKSVPAGFLALGDAICSFNPVYGQGMAASVLEAVELGRCLDDHDNDDRLVLDVYRRAAKVIAAPWQIAVGADFAYAETEGRKPAGTDLVNRYLKRVLLAAQVSPEVNSKLLLVQNLLAPPSTLFSPGLVRSVRKAAREAERRNRSGAAASSEDLPIGA
jgi:2-polyprenyl-6-methoxyphenol hydroxylase-like FAD-dependent oxidoreductase